MNTVIRKVTPKRSTKTITPHNNNNPSVTAAYQWKRNK